MSRLEGTLEACKRLVDDFTVNETELGVGAVGLIRKLIASGDYESRFESLDRQLKTCTEEMSLALNMQNTAAASDV